MLITIFVTIQTFKVSLCSVNLTFELAPFLVGSPVAPESSCGGWGWEKEVHAPLSRPPCLRDAANKQNMIGDMRTKPLDTWPRDEVFSSVSRPSRTHQLAEELLLHEHGFC